MTRAEAMTELNRLLEFGEGCAPPVPCDMLAAVEYALRVLRLDEAMDRAPRPPGRRVRPRSTRSTGYDEKLAT